jgi:hypothetical protein
MNFPVNKFVCPVCIKEKYLNSYISEQGKAGVCDYCKHDDKVLPIGEIALLIEDGFDFLYERLNKETLKERMDLDFIPNGSKNFKDSCDLIKKWITPANIELLSDISEAIQNKWWFDNSEYSLNSGEKKYYTWDYFSTIVKHQTRYIFTQVCNPLESLFGYPQLSKILNDTLELFTKFGLYTILPKDTIIYRALPAKCDHDLSAKELGSPPNEICKQANRFSPAGISMFYGAEDKKTCLLEIDKQIAVIGKWSLTEEIKILDLTKCTNAVMPSIFDKKCRVDYHDYKYILDFKKDLSDPIDKDGCENYKYAPTQIVAEFLKVNKPDVFGICIRSSINEHKKNYTLFFDNEDCCNEKKLKLISQENTYQIKRRTIHDH